MIRWSTAAKNVLQDYLAREKQESELMKSLPVSEGMQMRDQWLLQVGEDVGAFLHTLVLSKPNSTILELGTSYGYSTLFLAHAAKQSNSKIISIELNANKQQYAQQELAKAEVSEVVDFRCGDVLETLANLDMQVDIVLIDIWKELYQPCLAAVLPYLNKAAVVIADNMVFPPHHKDDVDLYRHYLYDLPQLKSSTLLQIGSGIEVSVFN
jgi:predicted O-methyltransferase YrrM